MYPNKPGNGNSLNSMGHGTPLCPQGTALCRDSLVGAGLVTGLLTSPTTWENGLLALSMAKARLNFAC